jgi:hypothetical protein
MIKKTASSEVFDIYASKMISKRSLLNKTAGVVADLIKEFSIGAEKVGAREIEETSLKAVANPTAKESLSTISSATEPEVKQLTEALANSSVISEASDVILKKAKQCGYVGFKDANSFLKEFSKDFKKMGEELSVLGKPPGDKELAEFYSRNKKAIEYYRLLEKDQELIDALKKSSSLGEKQLASGGKQISRMEAEALHTEKGADEAALAFTKKWTARGLLVGTAISLTSLLGIISLASYAYPTAREIFGRVFASPENERHIKAVKDAIKCINNIELIPGSPAVSSREKIINNIQDFSKYETLNQITDQKEFNDTASSAAKAAQELMSDASTEGSIQNFLVLIAQNPDENLSGYSSLQGAGAGALAGGTAGFMMGGPIGAAIGAGLAGYAGWRFISKYYEDETTCIASAGDAIKQYDELIKSYSAKAEEKSKAKEDSGPQRTSDAGTAGSSVSLLENMVGAMSQSKIYNIPGLRNIFLNEKKIVSKLVENYGVSQASSMISRANPNIEIILKSIPNPNLKETVNAATIEANPVLQNLAKAIVFGARSAEKSRPTSSTLISQSKIKEDKMKKESKSINNQELIRKAAEARVSYFGDASLGLKDQLTKSYYAGLTGMYNEQPTRRSSDYKDLYGFQEETGQDLVLESHPKSVTLADAMGKGGLVENNLEQQQKSIYVATTTPSGNFQSKYAQTVSYLQKLAKAADSQGKKEVSKLINQTIQKLK